ncbi:MAG: AraC family ligand binding domain-containing protein [Thermoanaerobaculia bacterium]
MPRLIEEGTVVTSAGSLPKRIEELVGAVHTGDRGISVARMSSPAGWEEPGQRPEFREITVVVSGAVRAQHEGGTVEAGPGQAIVTEPGEWVRYSTPRGAEYLAICLPAFSPETVHRDEEG